MAKHQGSLKRKKKNPKKGKGKKNNEFDWYSNDDKLGRYAGFAKSRHQGKFRGDAAGDSFEQLVDSHAINGQSGRAGSDLESDSSSTYDSDDESNSGKPLTLLLNGLEELKGSLQPRERNLLKRVESEKAGIDYVASDDDGVDNLSDENAADDTGETSQPTDDVDYGTDDEAHSDHIGTSFEKRFVSLYGMNDEADLEKLKASHHQPVLRSKSKVHIQGASYSVSSLSCPEGESIDTQFKFSSASETTRSAETIAEKLQLKLRLSHRWVEYANRREKICRRRLKTGCPARNNLGLTEVQTALAKPVIEYRDVMFCSRSLANASELRELYVLHALNHVIKSVNFVAKHSQSLKVRRELLRREKEQARVAKAVDLSSGRDTIKTDVIGERAEVLDDQHLHDQGFTRPRVLIIVPNRLAGLRVIRMLIELLPSNANVVNKKRFWDEFSESAEDEDGNPLPNATARVRLEKLAAAESYDELYLANGHHLALDQERSKGSTAHPPEWHSLFSGNNDEAFRIGIRVSNPKLVALFSDFYNSDIIVATPVGIRMATKQLVGLDEQEMSSDSEEDSGDDDSADLEEFGFNVKEEEDRKEKRTRKENTDFLSSIELCIVDQADVLEMQNWQHVADILSAVNRKPLDIREDMDFSRLRKYFLVDDFAHRFRQTMVFTQHPSALVNALFVPKIQGKLNVAGMVIFRADSYSTVLHEVATDGLKHKFIRLSGNVRDSSRLMMERDDIRLDYFRDTFLDSLKKPEAGHTLIVVPSFLDLVPIRKLLSEAAASLGESGPRSKGKPWVGQARKQKRTRDGKKIKSNNHGDVSSALFTCISEYSDVSNISRSRGDFCRGWARVLLLTERYYFYNRPLLRGIRRIIFTSPPAYPKFYAELCNVVENEGPSSGSLVMFDERDALAVERLVGTSNLKSILRSQRNEFDLSCA